MRYETVSFDEPVNDRWEGMLSEHDDLTAGCPLESHQNYGKTLGFSYCGSCLLSPGTTLLVQTDQTADLHQKRRPIYSSYPLHAVIRSFWHWVMFESRFVAAAVLSAAERHLASGADQCCGRTVVALVVVAHWLYVKPATWSSSRGSCNIQETIRLTEHIFTDRGLQK